MSTAPPDLARPNVGRPTANQVLVVVRGIVGGVIGGALGYVAFRWLSRQGFYAHAVPGALLGLGAGIAARGSSRVLGIVCALAAAALIIVAEWLRAPFFKDGSFLYFASHIHQMDHFSVKAIMMGLGTLAAYWFGQGR